jgi:GDP-4-dehydro-6-deoxy-D-mannose reductase
VTGAQGFVGRYLVAELLSRRDTTAITGSGRSSRLDHVFTHCLQWAGTAVPAPLPHALAAAVVDHRYVYVPVDIGDRARMAAHIAALRPDVVIHLASGLRDDSPPHLFRTNVGGTLALADAMAEAAVGIARLVVCSTGAVYGAHADEALPLQESAPCAPVESYGESKLMAEHVSRLASERYGIETLWARLFNVIGAGEDDRHVAPQLARQAAEIAYGLRPPVIDVGDTDATRDFIDVRDVAAALAALAEAGVPGVTYNVGTGREVAVGSLLTEILDAAGLREPVEIRRHSVRPSRVRRHVAGTTRLVGLGFRPRFSLADSVRDVVRYYVERVPSAVTATAR